MFSGFPDPHQDPLVRGTDQRIRIQIRTNMSRIRNTAFLYAEDSCHVPPADKATTGGGGGGILVAAADLSCTGGVNPHVEKIMPQGYRFLFLLFSLFCGSARPLSLSTSCSEIFFFQI
jgi:hypothetical protein